RVHSPFVYRFMVDVLDDDRFFYAFKEIEAYRKNLLNRKDAINFKELGAGSNKTNNTNRKVADIAKYASASPKLGRLLFRLAEYFAPARILELGTSLGLGTMYLASPNVHESLISIEGDPSSALIAKNALIDFDNVDIRTGNFDDLLADLIVDFKPNLVYLDGNHQKEATIRYVNQLLPNMGENGILVLDDIYWSEGMQAAWQILKSRPEISLSIDLYRCGLLFVGSGCREKEEFMLKW
ncbi:MAG: putative O-methyltransferase YrrM, partial [Limisphaerales bacterium]